MRSENDLLTCLSDIRRTATEMNNRQLTGKHNTDHVLVTTGSTYDITSSMDVEYRKWLLTFTPDVQREEYGAAYKLYVAQDNDNDDSNVEWLRLPLSGNDQQWLILFHNFTRSPGSGSPQTFTMRAVFGLIASSNGTLSVTAL